MSQQDAPEPIPKSYTVADAVRAAQKLLNNRFGPKPRKRNFDELMDGLLLVDFTLLNWAWLGETITKEACEELAQYLADNTVSRAYLGHDADEDIRTEFGVPFEDAEGE